MSAPDVERIARVRGALAEAGLDAVLCARPSNVLMLTGYWPVVGSAVAVVTRVGDVAAVVPHGEAEWAARGWIQVLRHHAPASLDELTTPERALAQPVTPTERLALDGAGAREAHHGS